MVHNHRSAPFRNDEIKALLCFSALERYEIFRFNVQAISRPANIRRFGIAAGERVPEARPKLKPRFSIWGRGDTHRICAGGTADIIAKG